MIKGVARISMAVKDLDVALGFYRDALGFAVAEEIEPAGRGVRLVRLDAPGAQLEIMQPTRSEGPVVDFIEHRGEGLHHVAIEVQDLELEMRTLLARGVDLIDRQPRDGPSGRTAFIHPGSTGGVLIELFEKAP